MKRMVVTLTAWTLLAAGCKFTKKNPEDKGSSKAETPASQEPAVPSAGDSQNASVPPAEDALHAGILSDGLLHTQNNETVFMPEANEVLEVNAEISSVLALEEANRHGSDNSSDTSSAMQESAVTKDDPDFVRSCRIEAESGSHCLQNADGSSLFFCNGTESKSECETASFGQTCSKTIPASEGSGQAQVLTYFLPRALQDFENCDAGTLKQI